jgi:hypothetical protein
MTGIVFWRKDDDSEYKHLRFIISEPDIDDMVLVVSMTTFRDTGKEDLSCVLEKGEHPCITHKSYIRYDKALELNTVKLLQEKYNGNLIMRDDIKPNIMKRIQEGAKNSPALPGKFRKYFDYF